MKEEALKLAYEMDGIEFYDNPNSDPYEWACDAQRMILRLVEELDKKSTPVNHYEPTAWINHIKQTGGDFYELNVSGRGEPLYRHPPQTKPLNDEEIKQIYEKIYEEGHDNQVLALARAIEERHGIK